MDELDLTISVVTHNTRDLLKTCLGSIYQKAERIRFEVLVVDNGSTDGTMEMIQKEFPQVKLIENQKNLGFARANNQAIKRGKGRYFLLFNPDSIFKNGSLNETIKFMDRHPEVGILGCKILNSDGTIQESNASFPNLFTEFLRVFQLKKIIASVKLRKKIGQKLGRLLGSTIREYFRVYWDSERVRGVDWVTGACLIVKRKAIEDVGLLDENFFMYYEDADWCYRMHHKGWRVYYYPFFEIVHCAGKTGTGFSQRVFFERQKSMYYYFQKHAGKKVLFLLGLLVRSGIALRCMELLVTFPFRRTNQEELRKRLWAYLKTIEISSIYR